MNVDWRAKSTTPAEPIGDWLRRPVWLPHSPEGVEEVGHGVIWLGNAITQTLHVWNICLHWGGLGSQCRHIWQSHGASG